MTTMDDRYGDGSSCIICDTCGLCINCGDCFSFGCGHALLAFWGPM